MGQRDNMHVVLLLEIICNDYMHVVLLLEIICYDYKWFSTPVILLFLLHIISVYLKTPLSQ
jgi:hypothetical protein